MGERRLQRLRLVERNATLRFGAGTRAPGSRSQNIRRTRLSRDRIKRMRPQNRQCARIPAGRRIAVPQGRRIGDVGTSGRDVGHRVVTAWR